MRKRKKIKLWQVIPVVFLILFAVVCVYPLILIVFNAFSKESIIINDGYVFWPKSFSTEAFKMLLKAPGQLFTGLGISILESVGGTTIAIILQSLLAYALLDKRFVFKKPIEIFLLIAMYFPSGGVIASYVVNTELLHMQNNFLMYLLPATANCWGVFLFRTAYHSVPAALIESAEIDGASPIQVWAKVMIPLSKSFIMTQFFMGFVAAWRNISTSLYYMTDIKLQNLEYYVQQIIKDMSVLKQSLLLTGMDVSEFPVETMQFAVVFFSMVPALIIMPFVQKYFEKGAVVGAVKG